MNKNPLYQFCAAVLRTPSWSLRVGMLLWLFLVMAVPVPAAASDTNVEQSPSQFFNADFYLISAALIVLLIVILGLAKTSVSLGKVVSQTKKKPLLTILFLLASAVTFAQEVPSPPEKIIIEPPSWLTNPGSLLPVILFFLIGLTILVLLWVNMRFIKALTAKTNVEEILSAEAVAVEKKPAFLRRIYLRLVDSVPVEKEKDVLLDHDYDGIKELDNNLPPWWKYGFYVTIVFAFIYLINYHVAKTGKLQGEEYKDELLLAQKQKEERMKASAENVNEENVIALADADGVSKGKETFMKLCSACHRTDGGGQVGPNLTDEYWLHGGGIKNMFKTITYGVPNKGMISWQSQLSPKQIQQVASYILTLKGSNPSGPKEPQGDKWVDENTADSTTIVKKDSAILAVADTLKNN